MERFEQIGMQIMHRSGGGMMDGDPYAGRRSATAASASWWPGCSARPSWSPTTRSSTTSDGAEHVADVLVSSGRALRRRRRRAARRAPGSSKPEIDVLDEDDMAGDLIPPPSPAGRPERRRRRARARREREAAAPPGRPVAPPRPRPTPSPSARGDRTAASEAAAARRSSRPYRSRFGFVLGALIGVALAALAIGAAVYVGDRRQRRRARTAGRRGSPTPTTASAPPSRSPSTSAASTGSATATSSSASQAGPLEIAGVPLDVALRTAPQGGDIELHRRQGRDVHAQRARAEGLDPRRQAVRGSATCCCAARRSSSRSTRSATSTTSTWSSRCCRPPPPRRRATARRRPDAQLADRRRCSSAPATSSRSSTSRCARRSPPRRRGRSTIDRRPEAQRDRRADPPNLFTASFQQGQDAQAFLVLDRLPTRPRRSTPGSAQLPARSWSVGYARLGLSSAGRRETDPRPVPAAAGARWRRRGHEPLSMRRWPRRARSSWCWVTRCLTGSASGRACTRPHIASAACSAVSGVARSRISSTSASSSRSIFSSAVPSPSAGNGTPRRWSSQAPLTMAKRLRSAIGVGHRREVAEDTRTRSLPYPVVA